MARQRKPRKLRPDSLAVTALLWAADRPAAWLDPPPGFVACFRIYEPGGGPVVLIREDGSFEISGPRNSRRIF